MVWFDNSDGKWKSGSGDWEIMYANYSVAKGKWSNATVISDGYQGKYWNTGISYFPSIATDGAGNVHVVWFDGTDNTAKWGTDYEIMYANYSVATGKWSNATVISDGYKNKWGWNDGASYIPSIAADDSGNVYVVWDDETQNPSKWGIDDEIMYTNYSVATGKWSNATVISDGYNNKWGWNDGDSEGADIATDNLGSIYVVWDDGTNNTAKWGTDDEIMYAKYSVATGKWSNATVISDGYNNQWGWNTGASRDPSIVTDDLGNIQVVWDDDTNNTAKWGIDYEIMHAKYTIGVGWSNATVISDGYNNQWGWNTGDSNDPSIVVDGSGNIHVIWDDNTDNPSKWGTDIEIMYTKITPGSVLIVYGGDDDDDDEDGGEKVIIIPFGNFFLLFFTIGTIFLVIHKKYKIFKN